MKQAIFWIVIVRDRHCDDDVELFGTLVEAKDYARRVRDQYAKDWAPAPSAWTKLDDVDARTESHYYAEEGYSVTVLRRMLSQVQK